MDINHIVVTTDFSDAAREAYPVAASCARTFGAKVTLLHVAQSAPPYLYLHKQGIETDIPKEPYLDRLTAKLEKEAGAESFVGVQVDPRLLYDAVAHRAAVRFFRKNDVDFVITASHGCSHWTYTLLGSFALQLVRSSPVPVLIHRMRQYPDTEFRPRSVLVPFDFSENASAVFPMVAYLHEKFRPQFHFLFVLEPFPSPLSLGASDKESANLTGLIEESPRLARERFRQILTRELPGIDTDLRVAHGYPAKEILSYAQGDQSDLVLTATHGWTGMKHLLLGSVAERVAQGAPCPVLSVRPVADRTDAPTDATKGS